MCPLSLIEQLACSVEVNRQGNGQGSGQKVGMLCMQEPNLDRDVLILSGHVRRKPSQPLANTLCAHTWTTVYVPAGPASDETAFAHVCRLAFVMRKFAASNVPSALYMSFELVRPMKSKEARPMYAEIDGVPHVISFRKLSADPTTALRFAEWRLDWHPSFCASHHTLNHTLDDHTTPHLTPPWNTSRHTVDHASPQPGPRIPTLLTTPHHTLNHASPLSRYWHQRIR